MSIFLSPKLQGARFDDHAVPVEILEDFSALQDLIFDVAKTIYFEENPDRRRVPNGFTENVSIKLSSIGEGSAIANLKIVVLLTTNLLGEQLNNIPYIEKARDRIIASISSFNDSGQSELTQKQLSYFNRIGKSLHEGESMNFPTGGTYAVLNRDIRGRILSSINNDTHTDDVYLYAYVCGVSKMSKTFELDINGHLVKSDIPEDFSEIINSAFNNYESKFALAIKGVGVFDSRNHLSTLSSIHSIEALHPNHVGFRISELSKIEDNWFEGYGRSPNKTGLFSFEKLFHNNYNVLLPLPSIFPTIEGNIQLEWSKGDISGILEVRLSDLRGDLTLYNNTNDEISDLVFDLNDINSWENLNNNLEIFI